MLYVRPNYYHDFKCIAERCEATCCAGWQIVIDEASLERYEQENSAYGKELREGIDWEEGVFKQDGCRRCAFLKPDGLCSMYEHLGESSLCETCTNYPRHTEEFENIREISLAISCPEAAHIILGQKEPVTFIETEEETEPEEFEDFDPFFFSYLEDGRRLVLKLLQDRGMAITTRFALVQGLGIEMQEIIENDALFDLYLLYEKYEDAGFLANAVTELEKEHAQYWMNAENAMAYSKALFGRLYELEHLSDDWEAYLEQCWSSLYGSGAANYVEQHARFSRWCSEKQGSEKQSNEKRGNAVHREDENDISVILEQLLVYFIFTYFCGAVYDDNVRGKVDLSLVSVYCIYEMLVVKWIEQQGNLSMQDVERIVYRYSRELEHSDLNLDILES